MVMTASTMLSLGTGAPDFSLPDVITDELITLEMYQEKKALLIMFICKHCPYVLHIKDELTKLGLEYENSELGIIAISANDIETHPDDSPENLKKFAEIQNFRFPVCFDASQAVAKRYTAACTPDFFLFNQERKLVYRGQLDDSRPGNDKPVDGKDLRDAITKTLNGEKVSDEQKPSIGCNIKWRKGNEPDYFKN